MMLLLIFLFSKLWDKSFTTTAMSYGIESESKARHQYLDDSKKLQPNFDIQETGLWVSPSYPELACSPDGIVTDPRLITGNNETGLLEIKCPAILKNSDIAQFDTILTKSQVSRFCLQKSNGIIKLKTSHSYYYQVQMQMALTGHKWCDFVVWSNKGYIVDRIQFNQQFWCDMCSKLISFHHTKLCPEFF